MKTTPILLQTAAILVVLAGCSHNQTPPQAPNYGRTATFDVRHELEVKLPEGATQARVWMATPSDDPAQVITNAKVDAPYPHRIELDSEQNRVLYLETVGKGPREFQIVHTFTVTRREVMAETNPSKTRAITEAERQTLAKDLAANEHVIIDDRIRTLSRSIVGTEVNPIVQARKLYDWELDNIDYWVKDPKNRKASPVGSTEHCLTTKSGNCTDFHSLFASLARAEGLPTRIVYGVFLKKELDGQDVDSSYHCWPEFYAPGIGWIPHDVAVADIYVDRFTLNADNETMVRRTTADGYAGPDPAKVNYYFGNIEERRVTFSTGRDLVLSPKTAAPTVNALTKAYVEIDGKTGNEKEAWTRKLTYVERK